MLEPRPNPATLPAAASYHWTPALQGEFLGHLAAMGSVRGAALYVQMTPRAASDLRDRRAVGWAAAILVARASRHSSAILSSPRRPSGTILILFSAEKCRRVARRISFTTRSAEAFDWPECFGLISVPSSLRRDQNTH